MAVQTIYTGENYVQVPQTRGYAMQALSQFSQQQQARQTVTLQQAYKDRDSFARMLELDPVYASSQVAQKEIADIMDGYIDEMTLMNKNRFGPMSTNDLLKMQQARGRAMAKMNYIKGASDEFIDAAKTYNAAPDKYDEETWMDWKNTWLKDGTRPEGPALLPAAKDAIVVGLNTLRKDYGLTQSKTEVSREIQPGGTEAKVGMMTKWDIPDGVSMEDIIERSYSPEQAWNINKTFRSKYTPQEDKDLYMKMANGDEDVASHMYYVKKMKDIFDSNFVNYETVRVPQNTSNYQSREQSKTYLSPNGDTQYINNSPAFTRQKVYGGMVATKGTEGIRFQDENKYDIPAGFLSFSKELGLPPETRVWVKPSIAADGKVEFAIDSKTTGDITISVDEYNKLPKAQRKKYDSEYAEDGTATYRYKEPIPENITATGDVDVVGTFLDPLFLQRYKEWYGETKPAKTTTTTTGTSWRAPMKAPTEAGAPSSTNKYGL